jgi:hypothetical protein
MRRGPSTNARSEHAVKVFLAFLVGVFLVSAAFQGRGRHFQLRWLVMATAIVAASFYSLRVAT